MRQRPTSIEEYAELQVALGRGAREAVLSEWGLDEETLGEVDARFEEEISRAADDPGDGIPALLVAYDSALKKAQEASTDLLPLESFALVTSRLAAGGDVKKTLEALAISLDRYLASSRTWTPRLAADPDLAARFKALVDKSRRWP